jgi:hypothetical protein
MASGLLAELFELIKHEGKVGSRWPNGSNIQGHYPCNCGIEFHDCKDDTASHTI